ncbi:7582_t:CDS:2, partial [Dentiscutata heterogama]
MAQANRVENDMQFSYPDVHSNVVSIMNALSTPITYEGRMQDNISVKMFISICYNLQPSDLLALACVCKDFKNMLDEHINPLAGEIWCNSRNQFTIFKDKDPPARMNQQTFSRLLTFQNGCQFCKTKEKTPIIYWIPGVRSCRDCMLQRAFSFNVFRDTFNVDNEILGFIAPIIPDIYLPDVQSESKYYWISHVKNTIAFFMDADDDTRSALNDLRGDIEIISKEAQHYHEWTNQLYQSQVKDQGILFERLLTEIGHKLDYETSFKLQNDKGYQNLVLKIQTNPFLLHDWQNYKIKILQIVQKISCDEITIQEDPLITSSNGTTKRKFDNTPTSSNVQQGSAKKPRSKNSQLNQELLDPNKRRTRIIKRLRKLTYGTVQKSEESLISIRDPLYVYLSICPSFINPPIANCGSEYTKEFFEETLIPTLKREAEQLRASNVPPPLYLLDTKGAIELGFGCVPIFGCLLCTSITPCALRKIKHHVRSFHKIDSNTER